MTEYRHISVAVPMLDELENIPRLLQTLCNQTFKNFSLYVCVNQPDDWAFCAEGDWRRSAFDNNQQSLRLLEEYKDLDIRRIDRSSPGLGWKGKHSGVGWARKVLFEQIICNSDDTELIVSLDADTILSEDYLKEVLKAFNANPSVYAIASPYYHHLSGSDNLDRLLLRYECYMRHYLINLLKINNPYAFTALGSAMAFPLWAYKRVGGITPLQAGEDFYLMQKFAKTGRILLDGVPCVYPQGRISQRVPFGTGPALSLSMQEMDKRYPLWDASTFVPVDATFALFPELFELDVETPMTSFLQQQLKTDDLWGPLRRNFKQQDLFVRACQQKVDGLRIQQFLKSQGYPSVNVGVDFSKDSINDLCDYREKLYREEMSLRAKQHLVGCG